MKFIFEPFISIKDDLLAELEELEQEELDKKLLNVGDTEDNLPGVPSADPAESIKLPKGQSRKFKNKMFSVQKDNQLMVLDGVKTRQYCAIFNIC